MRRRPPPCPPAPPAPATPRRRGASAGRRAGFTVVEVIAAIVLLAVGLLALAGLGVTASRVARQGAQQTLAASLAQSRFDSLASLPCATLASAGPIGGTSTVRGIRERWVVRDGRDVKRLTDSLTVPRRTRVLVYESVIPCRND